MARKEMLATKARTGVPCFLMHERIDEFIGIYDADSTLRGELSYWIGARLGRTHCSLCDITHGVFTKKREWRQCSSQMSIPFRAYHRNDAPQDALDVADGSFPIVLARRNDSVAVVLTNAQLDAFKGSATLLTEYLESLLS
jgi:hypothetical protein